jgi:hypothetical protein
MPDEVEVLVEPYEDDVAVPLERWRALIVGHAKVRELLIGADPDRVQVSAPEIVGREKREDSAFVATAFDPRANRTVLVHGRLDDPDGFDVQYIAFRPNPTPEELRLAAEVLRVDEGFAELAGRDDVVIYQPMPPLADLELADGTSVRRPTLGILDPQGRLRHRFVAVDLAARTVDWHPNGIEHPAAGDCEAHLPVGVESLPDAGGPDRVRVLLGGQELWSLVVVRPRNSTPTTFNKGSGVELRLVSYRGKLVLWQAHVPILNVLYDDGTTYRDWQNQETPFEASGTDPVGPGWRLCTSPPATILESGTDTGNFQGVALWYEQGELRIVSEVQAGWYRYMSDWRLRNDGTIGPRFGFAGTRNPRTCMPHQHHVYWRLDFDIEGAGNDVVQQRGLFLPPQPLWQSIVRETSRKRSFFARRWRVLDKTSRRGYSITPGVADGTADPYGVSDLWFLRYRGTELDDGVAVVGGSPAQTQAKIDQYVTGESIDGADVVIWYAGHFRHDEQNPQPHQGHIVGPELRPINW